MNVKECKVGEEYWVTNGCWSFIVLSIDEKGMRISMSNDHETYIDFEEEIYIKIEPYK